MKILLLEDDVILQEIVEEHLINRSFEVDCFYDGTDALEATLDNSYDLLLLDVNVGGIDGFTLLQEVRRAQIKTAALFITSLQSSKDLQHAFDIGADDYIRKPFELAELDARIDNVSRRYNLQSSSSIEISKNINFFLDENRVDTNGVSYHLSIKQSEILKYLIKQKKQVVSFEELTYNLWDYENMPDSTTIRTYIKELRKVIGKDKIVTIRNQGYRFE